MRLYTNCVCVWFKSFNFYLFYRSGTRWCIALPLVLSPFISMFRANGLGPLHFSFRYPKKKIFFYKTFRSGIEPESSAWQAEILTIVLSKLFRKKKLLCLIKNHVPTRTRKYEKKQMPFVFIPRNGAFFLLKQTMPCHFRLVPTTTRSLPLRASLP